MPFIIKKHRVFYIDGILLLLLSTAQGQLQIQVLINQYYHLSILKQFLTYQQNSRHNGMVFGQIELVHISTKTMTRI